MKRVNKKGKSTKVVAKENQKAPNEQPKQKEPATSEEKQLPGEYALSTALPFPIYTIATAMTSDSKPIILVGGGGGISKTGVPNSIVFFFLFTFFEYMRVLLLLLFFIVAIAVLVLFI